MKKVQIVLYSIVCSYSLVAQSNYDNFLQAFQENDTAKTRKILQKWENEDPHDPELLTSYFNYYFKRSKTEVLSLTHNPRSDEHFIAYNESDTFYLGGDALYDDNYLSLAFNKINEGIKRYPNRLDMIFGQLYVLKEIEDWETFTNVLIETIKYSEKNENEWTWTKNIPKEDGETFFLSCVQSYQMDLYDTYNDDLLINMREIAQTVLEYYPENIESMSNIGITYILDKKYDEALEILLNAEKLNPNDTIVLNNIAHAYRQKGDLENAIKYYEKMKSFGDNSTKKYAQEKIDEINAGK